MANKKDCPALMPSYTVSLRYQCHRFHPPPYGQMYMPMAMEPTICLRDSPSGHAGNLIPMSEGAMA